MTSTGGTGHIHPLVPLAAEIQAAGHEVAWATTTDSCPMIERYGFRAVPAGISGQRRRELWAAQAPPNFLELPVRERRPVFMRAMFGDICTAVMRDDLVGVVDQFRPDVIIHDLLEFAAAPVGSARGIPHVTLAFGAALSPILLAVATEMVAQVWADSGLVPSPDAGLYDHLYLHPLPPGFGRSLSAPTVRSIRPMHFDGAVVGDAPAWTADFGSDRPGVYITFGTEMAQLAPWAAMLEAAGSVDADVVVTLGSQVEPSSLGAIPGNVRVERYVPQTHMLDRAAVVVSHAGSGTLFAAAARGIPQLCVPIAADQWDNSDALVATGAGLILEPGERSAEAILKAMSRLIEGHAHAQAARTLAEGFAALPHPRDHVATIEALV